MKSSLRTRLILSFVLVIVSAMGTFALLSRSTINQWFNSMLLQSGREYAGRAAQIFGWYYLNNGSWDGVEDLWIDFRDFSSPNNPAKFNMISGTPQPLLSGNLPQEVPSSNNSTGDVSPNGTVSQPVRNVMPPRDERMILADVDGTVVYDSNPDAGSSDALLENLDQGVQIIVEDQVVGTVIAASSAGILNTFQETFLNNVNQFVLFGGIGATLLAIAIGAWQAFIILRPVRALSSASHKLAEGDYSQRIPVTTDDELGEMTQSFNHMAAELEYQETLRRRSFADVAHELRTPLSVLQIDLESIEDGIIEPDAETIQRLQLEVGTLRKLVEDLRILSLADAGELKLDIQPVDLNGLLHINAKRMERQANEKGVEIIEDITEEDLQVAGDEQRLSQVFLNLLSNALQYTGAGGTITAKSQREGNQARVSIIDTGAGIAAEDIPHIFERLYRSDEARARQNGGSGLGLSIARSMIQAHKGKVWVESTLGKGSSFIIELPLLQD